MKLRFENCELDLVTGELRRDGVLVKTEPKIFALLVYLANSGGRLVSQEDLMSEVWQGRIVSDSAISSRISAARKSIGDNGRDQRIIKTVSRKGFRFLPEVERLDGDSKDTNAPVSGEPGGQATQKIQFCRSADGTRIAYGVSGSGPPLVRVGHWLTHLEYDWSSPIWKPFLTEVGNRYQLVRYDQRGNGLSDWDVTDFSHERYDDDLEAVIAASGLDTFNLYATSQGVPVAIRYAAKHPDRIRNLVLHGGYAQGRLVRDIELHPCGRLPAQKLVQARGCRLCHAGVKIGQSDLVCAAEAGQVVAGSGALSSGTENQVMEVWFWGVH